MPMFLADVAVLRMVGEEELDHGLPRLTGPLTVRLNLHPFCYRVNAGGDQGAAPFYLHHADPARSWGVTQLTMSTERGDMDANALGRFEDGGAFGNLQLSIVNCQMNHRISPFS